MLWDSAAQQLVSRPPAELATLRNMSFIEHRHYNLPSASRPISLTEIPEAAGGALDLELSFDVDGGPQDFGVAVRASRDSLAGAALQLMFNVSAADARGSRHVAVKDEATPHHLPTPTIPLSRWMNDTDLSGGDYNLTHYPPSSGATAATCQTLCDAGVSHSHCPPPFLAQPI